MVLTVEEVIDGFRADAEEDRERSAYANMLFQEAIRIGMELNNQYHTPAELWEEHHHWKGCVYQFRLSFPGSGRHCHW